MGREQPTGTDLRGQLEPYWRRRWLVLGIVVLLPAAVYLLSNLIPKTYEAETTILVRATTVSSSLFGNTAITTGSTEDTLTLLETTPVAEAAAEELGEPDTDPESLLGHIDAGAATSESGTSASDLVTITATDEDAVRASEIANAFAAAINATRTTDSTGEINETIRTLRQQKEELDQGSDVAREELELQVQELRGLAASQQGASQVIEAASVPDSPVSPNPLRNTALAFVFALLLAAGAVPVADAFNRRLRDPDELEGLLDTTLLAQIPARAFPGNIPSNEVVEAFQTLRASLTYFNLDHSLKSVIVLSPGHSEGKTTVATNLAVSLARDGRNVALIGADLRKPQAATRLGVDPVAGLEEVLTDDASVDDALQQVDAGGSGHLHVLGTSRPARSPSVLLGSQKMRDLLATLEESFELVIIDSPPLLAVSDMIPLLKQASGAIMVGKINSTHTSALVRAKEVIEAAGGKVLGAVATGTKTGGLYGYGGYGYGYSGSTGEEPLPAATNGGGATNGSKGSLLQRGRAKIGRG